MRNLLVFLCGTLTGLLAAWVVLKVLQVPISRKEIAYLRWLRRNDPAWPPAIPPLGGWPTGTTPYGGLGRYQPAADDDTAAN